jgi:hypothetical protein
MTAASSAASHINGQAAVFDGGLAASLASRHLALA